jgi:hypothetical protein
MMLDRGWPGQLVVPVAKGQEDSRERVNLPTMREANSINRRNARPLVGLSGLLLLRSRDNELSRPPAGSCG